MGLPTVAVCVNLDKSYGIGVLRGIKRWIRTHNVWHVFTRNGNPVIHASELVNWSGDGVIAQFGDAHVIEVLRSRKIPLVNVSNRVSGFALPSVHSDDIMVGKIVAEHFLDRGLEHLGFVGYEGFNYAVERLMGYADRCAEANRTVHRCPDPPGWEDYEKTGPVIEQWLREVPKPLGVFAANDMRARHVMFAAQRLGLRVPEDVAVVGVDNDDLQSQLADVPLSSVELATETIGYRAAQILSQLMSGEWVSHAPTLVPPIGVITRQSSDVLASRDPIVAKALEFIQQNSGRELPVTDVVTYTGISRRSLEVRFKKIVGRTLQDEIWRTHIDRAKALLIETELPMPDIARQSGFPNASRLSSVFRRETNTTPTKYRRLYRQY